MKKQLTEDVPDNGRIIRNLGMAANYLMSHVLHFYHLVALDYVDVNSTGLIPKGFFCPNYDSNYYARGLDPVVQTGGLGAPAYTVNNAPVANGGIPAAVAGDLTPYLAGQYVRALKFRRMAQQLGALFTGKMPQASSYTPGCVTVKPYDPTDLGSTVVKKVHELLYGGPGFTPSDQTGATSTTLHPFNGVGLMKPLGTKVSLSDPHPESLLGFIGKPADFWAWAADGTGSTGGLGFGFAPEFLPAWAGPGAATAGPLTGLLGSGPWKHGGTYLFDAVAAAHIFPEYFWFGAGYGNHLAWGIFEGGAADGRSILNFADKRLITRGRAHVTPLPNSGGATSGPVPMTLAGATHMDAKEFIKHGMYSEAGSKDRNTYGRHMWAGRTKVDTSVATAYTYAKAPRYLRTAAEGGPDDYVPYEVGPLSRLMSNARGVSGIPVSPAEVLAVNAGTASAYYPGILKDVDVTLNTVLSIPGNTGLGPVVGLGVFPAYGTNLKAHLEFLGVNVNNGAAVVATNPTGLPVFYLPPNAVNVGVIFSPGVGMAGNGGFPTDYYGSATLDRIAARALETHFVGMQMLDWFNKLDPTKPSNKTLSFDWGGGKLHPQPKTNSKGAGLTEAPRGALGHWVKIGKNRNHAKFKAFKGKVSNYQIITPTTWNICPKDHNDVRGPAEEAIMNTPLVADAEPIEVLRVIHSFDFCCACTVHVINAKKEKVFTGTIDALP